MGKRKPYYGHEFYFFNENKSKVIWPVELFGKKIKKEKFCFCFWKIVENFND